MLKYKIITTILFISFLCIKPYAQVDSVLRFNSITKKNTFVLAMQGRIFALSGTTDDRSNIFIYGFSPSASYFIFDKLNIQVSYIGLRSYFSKYPQYNYYYNNIETGINYFLARGKYVSLSASLSYFYGEYRPYSDLSMSFHKRPGSMLCLGGGANWRLKQNPFVVINADLKFYFNMNSPPVNYFPFFQTLSFGVNYFLHKPARK